MTPTPANEPPAPSSRPTPAPTPAPSLPLETATQMLRLGLSGPRRPVDDLIDRLSQPDGADWLTEALEQVAVGGEGTAAAQLAEGRATLDQLVAVKERSQMLLRVGRDREARLAGIAGYFLSLAAALRHHGKALSGRSRAELDPVLLDLAAVAPSPFTELLSDATLAPR